MDETLITMVADPLGTSQTPEAAPDNGVVIGRAILPLVYEGDAIFHIAQYGRKVGRVERQVEEFQEEHEPEEPLRGEYAGQEAPIARSAGCKVACSRKTGYCRKHPPLEPTDQFCLKKKLKKFAKLEERNYNVQPLEK